MKKLSTTLLLALLSLVASAQTSTDAIVSTPEGTLQEGLFRGSHSFFDTYGYTYDMDNNGRTSDLVTNDAGEVYIHNPFGMVITNSWLRGETTENDTVVFHLPQVVMQSSIEGEDIRFRAQRMVRDAETGTFTIDDTTGDVKFVWKGDSLKMVDGADGTVIIGLTDNTDKWTHYGDYGIYIVPMKEQAVTIPDGVDMQPYVILDDKTTSEILLGIDGNDVYLSHLPKVSATLAAKGQLGDDGKVTFPARQYMGITVSGTELPDAHAYFLSSDVETIDYGYGYTYDKMLISQEPIVFDYNAERRSLSNATHHILLNQGGDELKYFVQCKNPVITPLVDEAAVPADPIILECDLFDDTKGWGHVSFKMPLANADGQYTQPDKLFYRIYLDDELLTFTTEEYASLAEETTEIPYAYDDRDNFYFTQSSGKESCYYFVNPENVGVQAVYYGGGVESTSPIVWALPTAIKGVGAAAGARPVSIDYFDLSGRQVARPATGVYVKRITLSDGRQLSKKMVVK